MSYDSAKQYEPKWVFSWGYIDNTPEHSMADKFSPYLRNCRLDWLAVESRRWHSLLSTLTAWDYPRGIWSYLRTVAANDRLIVRHNTDATHKLYTITEAGVATSITTASDIASDNRMNFLNVSDVIYCMNWVDDYGKLDWTTYTTPSTWIANFSPSFAVTFNSSAFASGWSDNANKVYKSVWDNYEDYNSAWSDSFTFSETITWLAVNAQALFYFTKNTVSMTGKSDIQDIWWAINYTTRALTVKEWSVNHNSIVAAWNNIFYITPSNKILALSQGQSIDWYEVMEISERENAWISKLMSSLDLDQSDSFWYFLPKDNLIKWFFKTEWATFNDICIIYDTEHKVFLIDDNKFFYWWVNFKGNNYTISTIEPKLYKDEYWWDDEDTAINFRYETKYFDLWIPTRKKELWEARTYTAINDLAELTQSIIIDWQTIDTKVIDTDNIPISTWWVWTAAIWTYAVWTWGFAFDDTLYNVDIIRTRGDTQSKGKRIKFVFTNSTLAWRVRLEFLNMRIEVLSSLQNNLTV